MMYRIALCVSALMLFGCSSTPTLRFKNSGAEQITLVTARGRYVCDAHAECIVANGSVWDSLTIVRRRGELRYVMKMPPHEYFRSGIVNHECEMYLSSDSLLCVAEVVEAGYAPGRQPAGFPLRPAASRR